MAKKTYVPLTYDPRTGFSKKKASSSSSGETSMEKQVSNLDTRLKTAGMQTDTRNPVEKFFNLTPNQNVLFDVFELLDRPGQAIRNVVAPKEGDVDDPLTNIWHGLTGKDKVSGTDVNRAIFGDISPDASNLEKFGHGLLGAGTEMLLDPLNWVGVGLADDVVKLGGKALKPIGALDDVAKAGKNIVDITDFTGDVKKAIKGADYVKTAEGLFEPVTKFKDANKLVYGFNKGQDLAFYGVGKALGKGKDIASSAITKRAPELFNDLAVVGDDLKRIFTGSYKTMDNLGKGDSATVMKKFKGVSAEDGKLIDDMLKLNAETYKTTLESMVGNKGLVDDLLEYARVDMPDVYKNLSSKAGDLDISDIKKITDNIISGSMSDTTKFNYRGLLDTLGSAGGYTVGATAEEADRLLKPVVSILEGLGIDDFVLGGKNADDLRRLKLGDEGRKILKDFLEDFRNSPDTLMELALDNMGVPISVREELVVQGTPITSLLTGAYSDDILSSLEPLATGQQNVLKQLRESLLKGGQDVDVIENYVPLRLTDEKLESIKESNRYVNDLSALSEEEKFHQMMLKKQEGRIKVQTPYGTKAPIRSSYGNPVEVNRLNRELVSDDAPLFRTDMMEVISDVARGQFKVAENQILLNEALGIFVQSLKKGLDNDTIITTNPKRLFPDVTEMIINSKNLTKRIEKGIEKNSDELQSWLMRILQTNDTSLENIKLATNRTSQLGEAIPKNLQKLVENVNTLEDVVTPKLTERLQSVLTEVGVKNVDALDKKELIRRYNHFSENKFEVANYLKNSNRTLGMKQYSNINDLLDNLKYTEKFGVEKDVTSALKETLKEMLGAGDVYINKNIAGMIERAPQTEKSMQTIMDGIDKFMGKWKSAKLFNLGFPVRNLFGDSTNLFVGGMPANKIVTGFTKAVADVNELPKLRKLVANNLSKGLDAVENLSPKQARLWNEWQDFASTGITAQTRTTSEFMDVIKSITGEVDDGKALSLIRNNPQLKKLAGGILESSKVIDVSNRFNAWRWAKSDEGAKTIKELGFSNSDDFVRNTLLDYDDISKFEEDYMRKLFPFYTFMRKNTEFHVQNFAKNTRRYSQINDVAKNMYDAQGIDDKDLPRYIKESLQIPIGTGEDGNIRYLKLTPSFIEAFQTLTGDNVISGLNPIVKPVAEHVIGTDFFTGQEKDSRLGSIVSKDIIGGMLPIPQMLSPMAQELSSTLIQSLAQPQLAQKGLATLPKDLLQALGKGTLGGLLGSDKGGPIIGVTNPETNRYFNDKERHDELKKLQSDYKKITRQSLPTLDELREMGLLK